MSQRRIFMIINLALVAVCGMLGYYLANASYSKPGEIGDALELLTEADARPAGTPAPATQSASFPSLKKGTDIMRPLYALTPTPTPTPPPTPMPLRMVDMLDSWIVKSMDAATVLVLDQRSNEEFTLTLNGEERSVTLQGQTIKVKLCGIDLNKSPFEAKMCDNRGESVVKTFP